MSSPQYKKCNNGCGKEIYFGDVKAASGKSIPLEKGSKDPHQCPNSDFNMRKNKPKELGKSVIDYVLELRKDYTAFKAQTALRVEKLELSRWDFTTDDKVRALEEKNKLLTDSIAKIPELEAKNKSLSDDVKKIHEQNIILNDRITVLSKKDDIK